jgi:hypothetical protein
MYAIFTCLQSHFEIHSMQTYVHEKVNTPATQTQHFQASQLVKQCMMLPLRNRLLIEAGLILLLL